MLPEKPWRTDAILRLLASVLVCVFLGSTIDPAVRYFIGPQTASPLFFLTATAGAIGCFVVALLLLGRPWRSETFVRYFGGILVCIYAGFCFTWWQMHLAGEGARPEGLTWWRVLVAVLSFQGGTFVFSHRFLREHHLTWTEAFGFNVGRLRALWLGVQAAFAVLLVALALQMAVQLVLWHLGHRAEEQAAVQAIRGSNSWVGRVVLGFATVLFVPPAEELLFRGLMYPAIKRAGYPRLALWGTSLLFAAIHMNLAGFLSFTLLALVLVWLYEKTANLLAPIIAHSVFNGLNLLLLYTEPSIKEVFPRLP